MAPIGGMMKGHDVSKWRHQGACTECAKVTDWTCPECSMYGAERVWLCPTKACRDNHAPTCACAAPKIVKAAN